jgi:hypothetical protein
MYQINQVIAHLACHHELPASGHAHTSSDALLLAQLQELPMAHVAQTRTLLGHMFEAKELSLLAIGVVSAEHPLVASLITCCQTA